MENEYNTPADVYAIAKVLIFKQITTFIVLFTAPHGCLCYCKGTNF